MKLQHYLGGLEGLPKLADLDRRVFAEGWERRIFAIHVAMMGLSSHLHEALQQYPIEEVPTTFRHKWTWADLRAGGEAMNPFDYFKYRYYEKWLGGITGFLIDKGYIHEDELQQRIREPASTDRTSAAEQTQKIDRQIIDYLRHGDSPRRDVAHPKFNVQDAVRVTNTPAAAHTRLPGYLRGRTGVVTRVFEGDYAYPVHTGDGIGEPMAVYMVAFDPAELWGAQAEPGAGTLYAELYEAYLGAA